MRLWPLTLTVSLCTILQITPHPTKRGNEKRIVYKDEVINEEYVRAGKDPVRAVASNLVDHNRIARVTFIKPYIGLLA